MQYSHRHLPLGICFLGLLLLSPNLSIAQMLEPLGGEPGHQETSYIAVCGIWPDGKFDEDGSRKTIEFVPVVIPLEGAVVTADNPFTFGTGRVFDGNDGGDGCNGEKYSYAKYVIHLNWYVYDGFHGRIFHHDDNKAFWDWFYTPHPIVNSDGEVIEPGYTAPPTCDYLQNCFGYAYDTNNFVLDPDALTGRNPFFGFNGGSCFEEVSKKDASFAHEANHAMKVTGDECTVDDDSIGCVSTPDTGDGHCKVEAIVSSSEQFRESGTYSRSISCPKGLAVDRAHREMHAIQARYTDFKSHKFLVRKKP